MDNYIAGIRSAWLGECLGFAAFTARAEAEQEEVLADKWRILAQLEEVTGQHMASVLKAHGETVDNEPNIDEESEAFQTYLSLPHGEVVSYMRDRVLGALERFEHLLAIAPTSDLEHLHFLIDHELALLTFVDRESSGRGDSLSDARKLLSA